MGEEIENNSDLSDIENALRMAMADALASAEEFATYKDLFDHIKNHYGITNINWDAEKKHYTTYIEQDGVDKLLNFYYSNEDPIVYNAPRDGYFADPNSDVFIDTMESNLNAL